MTRIQPCARRAHSGSSLCRSDEPRVALLETPVRIRVQLARPDAGDAERAEGGRDAGRRQDQLPSAACFAEQREALLEVLAGNRIPAGRQPGDAQHRDQRDAGHQYRRHTFDRLVAADQEQADGTRRRQHGPRMLRMRSAARSANAGLNGFDRAGQPHGATPGNARFSACPTPPIIAPS